MRPFAGLWVLSFVLVAPFQGFAGEVYDELNDAQKAAIQRGKQVFLTEDVPGAPWPRTFVYQRIEATPEEAMAVFFDVERQKDYVPNLKKSKISKVIDARTREIDYTLKVPVFFIPDEDYTVRTVLSTFDNGAAYRTDWTLVRADTTKESVGSARFEALGTGTILGYVNFVRPGSSFADAVENKAMKQVQETVRATVKQIETIRLKHRDVLENELEALRAALSE